MVHSAATVQGPVEKWVVPIWSLQIEILIIISIRDYIREDFKGNIEKKN